MCGAEIDVSHHYSFTFKAVMDDLFQNIRAKFSFLPEEQLAHIAAMGEMIRLKENEIFIRQGEKVSKIGLILQGLMRNYITDADGEEITVMLAAEMRPIAPYQTIFFDKPATETSVAIEPSVLFVLDFHEFKKRALADPYLMRVYLELLEIALIIAIQRIEDFTQLSPEERYRRILDTEAFLIDRTPLKHLASYLGITPVSLSRIRKRLSKVR
jgi:CRP-like cAMP-binding protein